MTSLVREVISQPTEMTSQASRMVSPFPKKVSLSQKVEPLLAGMMPPSAKVMSAPKTMIFFLQKIFHMHDIEPHTSTSPHSS
jgi:hypothetical protein